MSPKRTDDFVAWLDDTIRTSSQYKRLPSYKQLTRHFNLSHTTIAKIIKTYCEAGKLQTIPGKGIFAGPRSLPAELLELPRSSVERLVCEIEKDILSGIRKRGQQLLSVKALSIQNRVSQATAVSAYRRLRETGRITKIGKKFFVGTSIDIKMDGMKYEIPFFFTEYEEFSEMFKRDAAFGVFHLMEEEMLAHKMMMRYYPIAELQGMIDCWIRGREYPIGMLVHRVSVLWYGQNIPLLRNLIKSAGPSAPSILLVGATGAPNNDKKIHVFQTGSMVSMRARVLAEYAVRSSHSRVCVFFSGSNIASFLALTRIWPETVIRDSKITVRYYIIPSDAVMSKEDFFAISNPRFENTLKDEIILTLQRKNCEGRIDSFARDCEIVGSFEDAFPSCKDSAIWIFSSTGESKAALHWCRKNHIAVPGNVSIISLENIPENISLGISSCIDDWNTIGYIMAHSLIGDFPVERTRQGFMRVSAKLLNRNTTR